MISLEGPAGPQVTVERAGLDIFLLLHLIPGGGSIIAYPDLKDHLTWFDTSLLVLLFK